MANEKQTNGMEDLGPKRDNGASQEKIRNGRNGRVNGVRTAAEQEREVSRRAFVVGTGAAAAGVVVGGMVGYGVSNGKVSSVDPFAAPFPTLWIGRSLETCTGCKLCEIACSQEKEGGVVWPAAARIRVHQYPPCVEFPVACYLCGPDAECIKGCSEVEALRWDAETSTIRLDTDKCLRTTSDMGCVACANACPGKVIVFHPTSQEPLFCDLCDGKLPCVEACPTRAITSRGVSGSASSPTEIAKHLGHMYDLPLSRTAEGEEIAAQPGQEG